MQILTGTGNFDKHLPWEFDEVVGLYYCPVKDDSEPALAIIALEHILKAIYQVRIGVKFG